MTVQSTAQKADSVAMRIIEEVADLHDVDPVSLTPPLGAVVDPDALDALLRTHDGSDVAVEFSYADCRVSVTSDDVVVRPTPDHN